MCNKDKFKKYMNGCSTFDNIIHMLVPTGHSHNGYSCREIKSPEFKVLGISICRSDVAPPHPLNFLF